MDTIPYENTLICEMGNGSTPFTDLDSIQEYLTSQHEIERSYVGLENSCHIHFVIDYKHKVNDKVIKELREQLYKISGFQRKKKGGANAIVIKESQFNLEKYKELNQAEQKYHQYIYTFKEYDTNTTNLHRRHNIPRKLCKQYHDDYWTMYRKIIKTGQLKKKQNSQKTKSLRESLKDYFQEHRKQKINVEGKTEYLLMSSIDYIKIVSSWYQVMGIEHSVTDCERRALMLIAMSQPELHENIILQNLSNKFLY